MSTRIAGIGVGLFILLIIWVLCLSVCLALSRAQGGIANAGIGSVLLAVIVTVILVFFPRGDVIDEGFVIYDTYVIGRTALISCCGIMLLVGLVAFAATIPFEPQKAAALKKIKRV